MDLGVVVAAPIIVESADGSPVREIPRDKLDALGQQLWKTFETYSKDRFHAEQQWLKNLRQYKGIYDPEILKELVGGPGGRSRAYPRITRIKCISVLSRIMNLMFPGNEKNWELKASPSPDMSPQDVQTAVEAYMQRSAEMGVQEAGITEKIVMSAVQAFADEKAKEFSTLIEDQLQEIGGDQTLDIIALSRAVAKSGIMYGLGVLHGPMVREVNRVVWGKDPMTGQYAPTITKVYKPQFEFGTVWDFYPDMAAKTLSDMDGYFLRKVMSRGQLRKLAERTDFLKQVIREYLAKNPRGNFKALPYETELRNMGLMETSTAEARTDGKFEIIVWHGPVDGHTLQSVGVEVLPENLGDDIEAEVWLLDGNVIKVDMNAWRKMGADVRMVHPFLFDEDDSSVVGQGLPQVVRDSQMSVCAATRMLLDNGSVVCGPNIEVNMDLMRAGQDLSSVQAYKVWYREGMGMEAQYPAVRNISIDSHMDELLKLVELFMGFADAETFVGPMTGGDMDRGGKAEPMRTAAGASMLRSDAALPFKDIVRSFDTFTQSLILSLVQFNRALNPNKAPAGDYDVIARGATSLIAKEVRGMQLDQLSQTLTPEERMHIDERKLVEQKFAVRDMSDVLVSADEAERRKKVTEQAAQANMAQQMEAMQAEIRKTLSDAFKNIAQAQKNMAGADAQTAQTALSVVEAGVTNEFGQKEPAGGSKSPAGKGAR